MIFEEELENRSKGLTDKPPLDHIIEIAAGIEAGYGEEMTKEGVAKRAISLYQEILKRLSEPLKK